MTVARSGSACSPTGTSTGSRRGFGQTGSTLRRASVSARASSCRAFAAEATFADPGRDFGWRPLAVDGTEIIYVDARGVFATAPEELRWRPCG